MWQKNKNHPWEKDANKVEFSLPHFSQSLLKDIIANKLLCILLGEIPPFSSVSWETERECVCVCVCVCNWVISLISRMGKPRGCAWLFASPEDDMSFREGLEITAAPGAQIPCPLPLLTPASYPKTCTSTALVWLPPAPIRLTLISLQGPPWDKLSFSCGKNLLRSPGASLLGQTVLTHRGFLSLSRPFWFKAACQMLRLW